MNAENATWVFIGLAAALYVGHRHTVAAKKVIVAPSAQREVDPTRWRHDGSQPIRVQDGNRSIPQTVFNPELELRDVLAFA